MSLYRLKYFWSKNTTSALVANGMRSTQSITSSSSILSDKLSACASSAIACNSRKHHSLVRSNYVACTQNVHNNQVIFGSFCFFFVFLISWRLFDLSRFSVVSCPVPASRHPPSPNLELHLHSSQKIQSSPNQNSMLNRSTHILFFSSFSVVFLCLGQIVRFAASATCHTQ